MLIKIPESETIKFRIFKKLTGLVSLISAWFGQFFDRFGPLWAPFKIWLYLKKKLGRFGPLLCSYYEFNTVPIKIVIIRVGLESQMPTLVVSKWFSSPRLGPSSN